MNIRLPGSSLLSRYPRQRFYRDGRSSVRGASAVMATLLITSNSKEIPALFCAQFFGCKIPVQVSRRMGTSFS